MVSKKMQWILLLVLNSAKKEGLVLSQGQNRRIIIFAKEFTYHGLDAFEPFQMKDELYIIVTGMCRVSGQLYLYLPRVHASPHLQSFVQTLCKTMSGYPYKDFIWVNKGNHFTDQYE